MKVKSSLILIISILFILVIPNIILANIINIPPLLPDLNSTYLIKCMQDEYGNNVKYGIIIAYIDGVECGRTDFSEHSCNIIIKSSGENIDKEITFSLKIEGVLLDAIPTEKVFFNNYSIKSDISLIVSKLPPLITNLNIYINNELTTKDIIVVNIEDNLKVNVIGKYNDDSEKDISNNCVCGMSGSFLGCFQELGNYEFKAIKAYDQNCSLTIEYGWIEQKLNIQVVDIPPILLQSSIQDNATNIPISNTFNFTFDKKISQGNNFSSISILNSDGTPLGVTKIVSGDVLTINPIVNLKYDSNYILYIPIGSIKNLGTQSNTTDLMYHFTTVKETTDTEPLVTGIKVGDTPISNFTSNITTYNVVLPAGTTITPTITVITPNKSADIKIEPITVVPGSIEITVKSADGTVTETYILNITIGENDNCFIATAAYGSLLESHVVVLRHFRDNVLLKFSAGQWFVKEYYQYSPPIADYIRSNEGLRFAVRMILTPIIFMIEYWKLVGLGLLSVLGVLVVKRKYEFA